VHLPISEFAPRPIEAKLVEVQNRIIGRQAAAAGLRSGNQLRDGLSCPRNGDTRSFLNQRDQPRKPRLGRMNVYNGLRHVSNLAKRGGLSKRKKMLRGRRMTHVDIAGKFPHGTTPSRALSIRRREHSNGTGLFYFDRISCYHLETDEVETITIR